jgi:hypothetical protein
MRGNQGSDPEKVLVDTINYMVESKKYQAYHDPEEWSPFFEAMQVLLGQIVAKTAKLDGVILQLQEKLVDLQTNNKGLQVQVHTLTKEKTKCEEDIKRFEIENSGLIKRQREMRDKLLQYEKGLS